MAAKLLHSLTDENPDLQKQIGCITAIFQLFDRQPILTGGGRRVLGHHSSKKLIHGNQIIANNCDYKGWQLWVDLVGIGGSRQCGLKRVGCGTTVLRGVVEPRKFTSVRLGSKQAGNRYVCI
ncbi:hypothetical protein CASFOL_041965 [Castilleja foliolosa]|uniref:Uncharacterized protein n=1 Tax=Castilleja foliolosa TaxID=1961234 RepID=A0ABD3B9Z9_9LAMI